AAATAASIANGASFPAGTALLTVNPTPPPGFASTGIRINYEAPWIPRPAASIARSEMASAVAGGKLYAAGGTTGSGAISIVQAFDPALGTWASVAGLPSGLRQHSMAESGGNLYVTGGIDNGNNVQGTCLRYDPAANSWTAMASMPARWGHASVAVDGKIYVFGGYGTVGFAHMIATYVYDIAANSWSVGSTLPTWRAQMQAREAGGKIYVMGGTVQASPLLPVAVNEAYDIASDSWSNAAAMPSGRAGFGALSDHGRLYVVGGEMGGPANSALQYDPMADSWLPLNPMIQGRRFFALGVINGKAYASQGFGAAHLATTEEYVMPKTVYLVEKI
ncbi:MAG TPA: kelch repeat-containing protein, partial [Fibrobacteria bacterium]|nr:kelch repeat-containing protein [Fibrobacteria bacterium]